MASVHELIIFTQPLDKNIMKLIVGGASGYLATEVIRQSLGHPKISSVVALARKPVSAPANTPPEAAAKLKSVCVKDYPSSPDAYPEDVNKEFAGAGACIWTVAVTPARMMSYSSEDLRRICLTSTLAGFKAMHEAGPARPFRFVYCSGHGTPRDQTKKPLMMGEYLLMRGETESKVLEYAAAQPAGDVQAYIPQSGIIKSPGFLAATVGFFASPVMPSVKIEEAAAAMIDAAVNGAEKNTLVNDDLVRIGRKALQG